MFKRYGIGRKNTKHTAVHIELEEEIKRVQRQFKCTKLEASAIVADKSKRKDDYNIWGKMKLKQMRGLS